MCFNLVRKNPSENKRDRFSELQAAQMLDSKLFFLRKGRERFIDTTTKT